ncbi:MAG TPA: hypothetical protein PK867_05800 [Pirellulales bacterium]|nr:hypothetical protein [Pirellulales bacterium]
MTQSRQLHCRCLWAFLPAVVLLVAAGHRSLAAEPTDSAPPADAANDVALRGRVLLPDGKAAAGADLFWPHAGSPPPKTAKEIKYQKRGVSDAEGRFEIALSKNDMPASGLAPFLVAHKAGFGIDWYKVEKGEVPAETTLQLVEDRPIRGRLIDTEGRPIAGARLAVKSTLASREGSLDTFLTALERSWHDAWQKLDHPVHSPLDAIISAESDRDGRFELSGVGVERLASLEIVAAGHAADQFYVVNRQDFDADKYNDIITEFETPYARQNELHPRLAGPNLAYIAEGELVVRGKVFTGPDQTPLSGAVVYSYGRGQGQILSTTTDEQGRYELHGLPRNRQYPLSVPPPTGGGLLPRTVYPAAAAGQTAIDLDLELKQGIVVEGRVVDQATGRGLKGGVRFTPLPGNDFVKQPGFDGPLHSGVPENTDDEGRFRLIIIPGPGVLLGHAYREARVGGHKINPYRQATFSEEDRNRVLPTGVDDRHFTAADNSVEFLGDKNAAKVLDLPPDAGTFHCDLPVDRGKTVELSLEDGEGQPVRDAFISGLADCWRFTFRIADPTCTIYALGADRPRRTCILHPERGLAASLTLTGDEEGPVKVRLGAAATITGRALETSGEPIADAFVTINYARLSAREIDRFIGLEHPAVKTDDQGRFEIGNILPGERFALDFRLEKAYFRANLTDEQRQLKAGQKLEPGDMKVKQLR